MFRENRCFIKQIFRRTDFWAAVHRKIKHFLRLFVTPILFKHKMSSDGNTSPIIAWNPVLPVASQATPTAALFRSAATHIRLPGAQQKKIRLVSRPREEYLGAKRISPAHHSTDLARAWKELFWNLFWVCPGFYLNQLLKYLIRNTKTQSCPMREDPSDSC